MNITIDNKAFKIIMDKLSLLEATFKALSSVSSHTKLMKQAEAMEVPNLS